jgi:tetratricopeptide (TPR) repeat protein
MSTASNKLKFFNLQSFPLQKSPGAYRIFCLGGSTTYGRPYNDATSFPGWLRELLPAADASRNWEVVNAGGISYASYRVAHLMEELVNYQPDLFIIYTGHNEFLEDRTYGQIKDVPPLVRSTVSLLARTRTWSAMTATLQTVGMYPKTEKENRDKLAIEVDTILDRSRGPERYTRDDTLRENIFKHYRISLERMTALARSAGAQVIFVTPASNLKDSSPFKSEHTPGLDQADRRVSEQMLTQAMEASRREDWNEALGLLENAVALDPRHAELQYRRGQALLAMGRYKEAENALLLARDEDVCPLRALTPMRQIVADVAREQDVPLVDYIGLLAGRMSEEKGFPIPGEEYFLDHVHPTIDGHKILAVALIQAMIDQKLVRPGPDWGEQKIAAVASSLEGRIDREGHGQALANLARVQLWAGKNDDAARTAEKALEMAGTYRQVAVDAASIMTSVFQRREQPQLALQTLYSALEKAPGAIELRLKLGQALYNRRFQQYEEAAANLLLVCQQMPYFDVAHQFFGMAMAKRGRLKIAYASLMEALRLNPNNDSARKTLTQVRSLLGDQLPSPKPPEILLEVYPSLGPRKLGQVRRDVAGRMVPDGIEAEWYENGRIKRFMDVDQGVPNGFEMIWDTDGKLLSRVVYKNGKPVPDVGAPEK